MVWVPVPKEVPSTKTQWLRRLQEYEDEDEEDVSIRASHHRLALDEQEMETNRRLGVLPPHAPASSSWEGVAPMLAFGRGIRGRRAAPSLLVPAAGGKVLVAPLRNPELQEVSPAVANAQLRTHEAKEALENATAAAEDADNELKELGAAAKGSIRGPGWK